MNQIPKRKFKERLEEFMFICGYILKRMNPPLRTKTCILQVSTSSRLTLAGAFRNDYAATCSTALRSATEENEPRGFVTVPRPSKVTQHSSTADWLNS